MFSSNENVLLTEGYKYLNGYSPDLMNKVLFTPKPLQLNAILMSLPLIIRVASTY